MQDLFDTQPPVTGDELDCQVVIPTHDPARPIRRAVDSVLSDPRAGVIVVAHNVDQSVLDIPDDPRVVVVPLTGAEGRPGAAFDAGLRVATAPWVGIMGSDDWYELGALQALVRHGEEDGADGVLAPLAYQGGTRGLIPRTVRNRNLKAAEDRLFYRTAPLGLYRRQLLQSSDYAFGDRYPVGEDLNVSTRLWTSGHNISYYPRDPAYVVGSDAKERTTLRPRPLAEHGAAWLGIWDEPWVQALSKKDRRALATKILRVHVLGAVEARPTADMWGAGDFEWLAGLTHRIVEEAPESLAPFRKSSAPVFQALLARDLPATLRAAEVDRSSSLAAKIMPSSLAALLSREAPMRWQAVAKAEELKARIAAAAVSLPRFEEEAPRKLEGRSRSRTLSSSSTNSGDRATDPVEENAGDVDETPGRNAKQGRTVLVLVTGAYPANIEDASFIRNEINQLAEAFDVVHVYSFDPLEGEVLSLPANVEYKGSLKEVPRSAGAKSMMKPGSLGRACKALSQERRAGRFKGNASRVLGNIFSGTRFASAIMKNLKPDDKISVYAFWGTDGAMALPFLPASFRKTMRLHRFDLYEEESEFLPLRGSLLTQLDNVVPISEDGRQYLLQRYGDLLDDGRLKLARLGTRDHGVGPAPRDNQAFSFASCSSVIPVKRVRSIIPALQLIAEHRPVKWTHFGSGALFDELAQVADNARQASTNLTIDLRGQTDNRQIIEYYQQNPVHALVNVSDSEGVPVSIMEALSFGIPVVATDVGGTGEVVGRELNSGVLLPKRPSTESLADALEEVAKNRDQFDPRAVWERLSNAKNTAQEIVDLVSIERSNPQPDRHDGRLQMLIVSFSDIRADARVLKQVSEFSRDFEVTTCSYGERPEGSSHHIQIPSDLISWAYDRKDLMTFRYHKAYWSNPAVSYATRELQGCDFDVALADDIDTVPLALSLDPRFGVHADLHEYAPREKEHLLRWRMFVGPFRRWLCATYLPECESVTTVSEGIAQEYSSQFAIDVDVAMNATPYQDLVPNPATRPIRLVHSGACQRQRELGTMVQAVMDSGNDVTLDLYLTPNDPQHLQELKNLSADDPRITIHDPVPYEELVALLNRYDVGISTIPPNTFNLLYSLPNKVFDYIQARLGVIVGPSPEMARIVKQAQNGAVAGNFSAEALTRLIDRLDVPVVNSWKQASGRAAQEMSAGPQTAVWRAAIEKMIVKADA